MTRPPAPPGSDVPPDEGPAENGAAETADEAPTEEDLAEVDYDELGGGD